MDCGMIILKRVWLTSSSVRYLFVQVRNRSTFLILDFLASTTLEVFCNSHFSDNHVFWDLEAFMCGSVDTNVHYLKCINLQGRISKATLSYRIYKDRFVELAFYQTFRQFWVPITFCSCKNTNSLSQFFHETGPIGHIISWFCICHCCYKNVSSISSYYFYKDGNYRYP